MGIEASKIDGHAAGSIMTAIKLLSEDTERVQKLMQSIETKDFDKIKPNDDNAAPLSDQIESNADNPKSSRRWKKIIDSSYTAGPLKRVKAKWLKYYRTVDKCAESNYDACAFASVPALASALTAKVVQSMGDKLDDPIVAQVCKLRVFFKWITINVAFDTDAYFCGRSAKVRAAPIKCKLGESIL